MIGLTALSLTGHPKLMRTSIKLHEGAKLATVGASFTNDVCAWDLSDELLRTNQDALDAYSNEALFDDAPRSYSSSPRRIALAHLRKTYMRPSELQDDDEGREKGDVDADRTSTPTIKG